MHSGVELGHAWIQHLADELGIRVLFLKGPALAHQGLRDRRVSSDVDVLVEPARFDQLCDEILARGWRERPAALIGKLTSIHSRTLLHDRWPCDIDAHRHYPGMLADPSIAFDALWAQHDRLTLGHRSCAVPNRVASIIVLALHSLRGTERQARHAAELEHLRRVPLTSSERDLLAELARRTGTTVTLFEVLTEMGVPVVADPLEQRSAPARRWRERVRSGSYGSYFWFAALRDARGLDRLRIAGEAVWPSRRDLLLSRPETVDTALGRMAARGRRWVRGARSLPRAVRAINLSARMDDTDAGGPRWN
ncbi:nucleotidyltransferase family protein [Microbacterium oleivorans]|uniref:Nucleotidyltransferase family protein n=1 Tax=Microbacterium oleivorans TaxID=273677 RepID=A0A7D5JZ75_9MICO|nr:nucleotidyltransferase family protein [Microbacterium oleivorans]